jgi:DMSO/TMAO reductase YedYZ molybdopterin-dependent catalytic subunit
MRPFKLALLLAVRLAAQSPLPPLALPPEPDTVPGYTEMDPLTHLHMTGTVQRIAVSGYRLKVTGKVRRRLSLTYDDLRRMPRLTSRDVIVCRGYFEDYAHWAGCALTALLDRCEPRPGAKGLELVSADGYRTTVTLQEARSGYAFLAYEWEGKALPVLHGFPVKAAFPGLPGSKWVKWLVEIRVE